MGIKQNWFRGSTSATPIMEPGIIVPYNDDVTATLPPEVIAFNPGTSRLIKMHPVPKQTGGSKRVTVKLGSAGNHKTGEQGRQTINWGTGRSVDCHAQYGGNHAHSGHVNYTPKARRQTFVQFQTRTKKLPKGCGFFSMNLAEPGFSIGGQSGEHIALTTGKTASNVAATPALSAASGGNHHHIKSSRRGALQHWPAICRKHTAQGNHGHGGAHITMTDHIKSFCITMWFAVNPNLDLPKGCFVLYDRTDVPAGWLLCDGSKGTPDMRDHFLKIDTANLGKLTGNNTVSGKSGSAAGGYTHSHGPGAGTHNGGQGQHGLATWRHTHGYTAASQHFEPEYYTLRVLMAE